MVAKLESSARAAQGAASVVAEDLRWDDLQLLLRAVERRSLLAAAQSLGLATSTLSRRLTLLERSVGRALLERRHDGVRPTEAGRLLVDAAQALRTGLEARLRALPGDARSLQGTVRISTGDGFVDPVVEALCAFRSRHPEVSFELAAESHVVDLPRGEADLALRTHRGREDTVVYQRLGDLPYGLFAAETYLQGAGRPRSRDALAGHQFVGFAPPLDRTAVQRGLRSLGARRFAVRTTTFAACLAAVRAGLGLGALPLLTAQGLTRVLPTLPLDPIPVYLCWHRDARELPHVRACAGFLADALRPRLAQSAGADGAATPRRA